MTLWFLSTVPPFFNRVSRYTPPRCAFSPTLVFSSSLVRRRIFKPGLVQDFPVPKFGTPSYWSPPQSSLFPPQIFSNGLSSLRITLVNALGQVRLAFRFFFFCSSVKVCDRGPFRHLCSSPNVHSHIPGIPCCSRWLEESP